MRAKSFPYFALWTALAALAGFPACQKKPTVETEPEPPPVATPMPATPAPVAITTPPPAIPEPRPATPAPELAPAGVFYLLHAARVETADGLVGLPPGTGVKLVRPGIYLTPSGEVPLDAALLTNDMAQARAALAAERSRQAAARAGIAAQGVVAEQQARTQARNTEAAQTSQAAHEQATDTAKAQAAAEQQRKIAELRQQIAQARESKVNYQRSRTMSPRNRNEAVRRVEAQIRELQMELSRLGVGGALLE